MVIIRKSVINKHSDKELVEKSWHVTTAIHNSRYSQRMSDNHVKLDKPIWLSEKDELVITESIALIVKEDMLNVLEYNICRDHMHILLVCEKEELSKIVGKLKAVSGRKCNIERGITVPARTNTDTIATSGTKTGTPEAEKNEKIEKNGEIGGTCGTGGTGEIGEIGETTNKGTCPLVRYRYRLRYRLRLRLRYRLRYRTYSRLRYRTYSRYYTDPLSDSRTEKKEKV